MSNVLLLIFIFAMIFCLKVIFRQERKVSLMACTFGGIDLIVANFSEGLHVYIFA